MKITNEIFENVIIDWRKKDIPKVDKAKFIRAFMRKEDLSLRTFCKRFDIPKTTVHDWLLYEKVDPRVLRQLEKKGKTPTQIHRALQGGAKLSPDPESCESVEASLDDELRYCIKNFYKFTLKGKTTRDTEDLLNELIAILRKIKARTR